MKPIAIAVALLTLTTMKAAPVPEDKAAKQKELESLWADLYKDDPAATTAALKLFKQPAHAVPFLKEKLRPLKLEEETCRKLLKELGSDDEKVWQSAWDDLDYLDPRLVIDLETLMKEITEKPSRTRMVELLSERKPNSLAGKDVQLRSVGKEGFNFLAEGSWWAEHRIDRIGSGGFWTAKRSWTRAARGVAILEQIGSEEAYRVLARMAEGHPDAFPTKAAKAAKESLAPRVK